MNIYNFSKGQLIILWVGLLFSFLMGTNASELGVDFFGIFIGGVSITALIIYTIGWRNRRKNEEWKEWQKQQEYKRTHKNPFKEE